MKVCPKCKIQKEKEKFWRTCSYCKDCQKENWRNRYNKNKESFAKRDAERYFKKSAKECIKCKKLFAKRGKYCSLECKFKFNIKKVNKCWLWQGSVSIGGYASICWNGKNRVGHRLIYEVYVGEIPKGMIVCHKCDVPGCINPDHLFLGTHQDNMNDAKKKGRMRTRVLKEHEFIEILEMLDKKISIPEIAKKYKVSCFCIADIKYKPKIK
jgi:hypothetical protein